MSCIWYQWIWSGALAAAADIVFQQLDGPGNLTVPYKFQGAGELFLTPLSCKPPQRPEAALLKSFAISLKVGTTN